MQIQSIQCFAGRNIHSHRPVIKVVVDIGELYKSPTKDMGILTWASDFIRVWEAFCLRAMKADC